MAYEIVQSLFMERESVGIGGQVARRGHIKKHNHFFTEEESVGITSTQLEYSCPVHIPSHECAHFEKGRENVTLMYSNI